MRVALAILLIPLWCWPAIAQQLTHLPPSSLHHNLTPGDLQEQLDSASEHAFAPLHARYFSLHSASLLQAKREKGSLWNFSSPGFDIRLFLNIQSLPEKDTLILRNSEEKIIETLHHGNLLQSRWSSLDYTDQIILEHRQHSAVPASFTFEGYSLEPAGKTVFGTEDFGDAGSCEINVNCPEGKNYKNVQRSVVRIRFRIGSFFGWCTGGTVLTTAYDFIPYILTAEHCGYGGGNFATDSDLGNWEFYFNYTASGCSNPVSEQQLNFTRLTGARLVARSDDGGGDNGSDFLLLELTEQAAFESLDSVYFTGWDRSGTPPSSGVTIHHPQGDIKKISTFSATPTSTEIGITVKDTHWEVNWVPTTSGHGVTEFGSSGAPLLSRNGLMHGLLTGGFASCNNLFESDFFGKFSYSWKSNGSAANRQLAPWLDPENTGVLALPGSYRDTTGIPVDTTDFFVHNLVTDTLSIHGLKQLTEETEVQIFSLNGKLLYRKKTVTLPNIPEVIDVSNYPSSMFIVRLVEADSTRHFKVVILNL